MDFRALGVVEPVAVETVDGFLRIVRFFDASDFRALGVVEPDLDETLDEFLRRRCEMEPSDVFMGCEEEALDTFRCRSDDAFLRASRCSAAVEEEPFVFLRTRISVDVPSVPFLTANFCTGIGSGFVLLVVAGMEPLCEGECDGECDGESEVWELLPKLSGTVVFVALEGDSLTSVTFFNDSCSTGGTTTTVGVLLGVTVDVLITALPPQKLEPLDSFFRRLERGKFGLCVGWVVVVVVVVFCLPIVLLRGRNRLERLEDDFALVVVALVRLGLRWRVDWIGWILGFGFWNSRVFDFCFGFFGF